MSDLLQQLKWPFRWVRKETRKWKPPGFRGLSLYQVLNHIKKHYNVPGVSEKAAAISYNFIMSIPPTFLFLFTLIPNLPFFSREVMKHQSHQLIQDVIPSATYNSGLMNFVDRFIEGSQFGLISFTFLLSLFFASNGIMGLIRSFHAPEYEGFKKVKGIKQRWEAIKLTLMLFALLLVTLLLLLVQSNILDWFGIHNQSLRKLILLGKWLLIGSLIFFSYAFIYRYAPSTTKRWKLLSPGAIIATGLTILVTLGFSFFVENFGRYNILYGSIGSVMVVMIMIFLNALSAFIGFIFNLTIHVLCHHTETIERIKITKNKPGQY